MKKALGLILIGILVLASIPVVAKTLNVAAECCCKTEHSHCVETQQETGCGCIKASYSGFAQPDVLMTSPVHFDVQALIEEPVAHTFDSSIDEAQISFRVELARGPPGRLTSSTGDRSPPLPV